MYSTNAKGEFVTQYENNKLCAQAMGYRISTWLKSDCIVYVETVDCHLEYNPYKNDTQAMDLIRHFPNVTLGAMIGYIGSARNEEEKKKRSSIINVAIVERIAKLQKEKNGQGQKTN